ncbi:MAG: formate dehydrogenase accessory sulfurtransferase FdhD [Bacteroidetes bacterium]|nr:formate dehydrogenase accessory sulfurtransferase FdhD [Bacteroidota bacterium]
MSSSLKYEGLKFSKGSVAKVADPLAVEQALQININNKSFTVVMQTPGAEKELVYGLLYGEDVLKKDSVFELELQTNKSGFIELVNVHCDEQKLGKGYLSTRSLLSVSSCGICGKQELGDLNSGESSLAAGETFSIAALQKMQQHMFDQQTLFKETGGCHGVAAFDAGGKMLALFEDIGRHNALDKVVGKLLYDKTLDQASVISFSGRVSYEIVSKSFRAKIPVIIAVSATSSLAVDFAKEFGLTLVAFARGDQFTCYANPSRILH